MDEIISLSVQDIVATSSALFMWIVIGWSVLNIIITLCDIAIKLVKEKIEKRKEDRIKNIEKEVID